MTKDLGSHGNTNSYYNEEAKKFSYPDRSGSSYQN